MANVLDEILAHKREEVEQARRTQPQERLIARPAYQLLRRDFYAAVATPNPRGPNVIAEIKRQSPSAGVIQADFDPAAIARQYAAGGAQALSVLTDERYFGGRLEHIALVKDAVELPVLRKDFLVDPYQVHESRAYGADAVLVIAEALEPARVRELVELACELGLCVVLEVHTRVCLTTALGIAGGCRGGGVVLGINNRDLQAQRVDLATVEQLAPLVPPELPIVAESGLKTRADVERMQAAGARAVLVGEALLRNGDPATALRRLRKWG